MILISKKEEDLESEDSILIQKEHETSIIYSNQVSKIEEEDYKESANLSDKEEENQNVKSISFIKTPYNSTRPRDDEEDLFYDDVNIEDNIMKFLSKVGELSLDS